MPSESDPMERKSVMGVMKVAAKVIGVAAAVVTLAALALSIPDAARYARLRRM